MSIKTIPLSSLEANLRRTLNECASSGQAVIVELPDQSLLTIQPLDLQEDDKLIDELLKSNSRFRALLTKSKASGRNKFFAES